MVVLKRRSRVVTFRVFADEYNEVTKACLGAGARSVSEFARLAVLQRTAAMNAPSGTLSGDLATLSKALLDLDCLLYEARKQIQRVLGPINKVDDSSTPV